MSRVARAAAGRRPEGMTSTTIVRPTPIRSAIAARRRPLRRGGRVLPSAADHADARRRQPQGPVGEYSERIANAMFENRFERPVLAAMCAGTGGRSHSAAPRRSPPEARRPVRPRGVVGGRGGLGSRLRIQKIEDARSDEADRVEQDRDGAGQKPDQAAGERGPEDWAADPLTWSLELPSTRCSGSRIAGRNDWSRHRRRPSGCR